MGSLSMGGTMYTVAKGPTVIVQKTRRGLAKSLDLAETARVPDSSITNIPEETSLAPKIVFQPVKMRNNRKQLQTETVTPEHREIVTSGWEVVKSEIEQGSAKVKYYQELTNPRLSGFQPFDLDAWWGKRLYHSLTRD